MQKSGPTAASGTASVSAETRCPRGRDCAKNAARRDVVKRTEGQGEKRPVDAQQLTEIYPRFCYQKRRFLSRFLKGNKFGDQRQLFLPVNDG